VRFVDNDHSVVAHRSSTRTSNHGTNVIYLALSTCVDDGYIGMLVTQTIRTTLGNLLRVVRVHVRRNNTGERSLACTCRTTDQDGSRVVPFLDHALNDSDGVVLTNNILENARTILNRK